MSNGRLADQMGAMALVDDLRHRRMEIEEHLDLPKREAEVAGRIRAYYQSQGIDCDDALVTEGVREFFKHRLVFEAPPMSLWDRFLGRCIASTSFNAQPAFTPKVDERLPQPAEEGQTFKFMRVISRTLLIASIIALIYVHVMTTILKQPVF